MKRETNITVEGEVILRQADGTEDRFTIGGIPCLWKWDEGSRNAAEYWALFDHVAENYTFDWMSIVCWSGTPEREKADDKVS